MVPVSVNAAQARQVVVDVAPPPAQEQAEPPVKIWFPRVAALQGLKDGGVHVLAKAAGLGAWLSVQEAPEIATVVAAAGGAVSGARIGFRLGSSQFGTASALGQAATALSTVAGGAVGALFALGHAPVVMAALWTVAQAGFLLVVVRCCAARAADKVTPRQKAVAALSAVAAGVVGYALQGCVLEGSCAVTRLWRPSDANFMARQMGAVVEAVLVECLKEGLSSCGPSVDRKGLQLEGRIEAAATALPAYAGACVVVNGLVGTRLLPPGDGLAARVLQFSDMAAPVFLSCVPNAVRGASNACVVERAWPRWRRAGLAADPLELKPAAKGVLSRAAGVADRAAVRLVLIHARQALYARMRELGCPVQEGTVIAQAIHAAFAQFRELYLDVMAGEGWTAAPQPEARFMGAAEGTAPVTLAMPAREHLARAPATNLGQRAALATQVDRNLARLTAAGEAASLTTSECAELIVTTVHQLADLATLRAAVGREADAADRGGECVLAGRVDLPDAVYREQKEMLAACLASARLQLHALGDATLQQLDAAYDRVGMHDARLAILGQIRARANSMPQPQDLSACARETCLRPSPLPAAGPAHPG